MVEQLHEIALLELQRIELNLIKVDLNWVVQEVVDVLQGPAITKKQTLTMTRSKNPLYVEIDIPKMKRILFNLVGNAIKYTREGGRIDVGLFSELSQAVVYVKDNGIGIPSDKLNIIFEPFSKLKRHGTSGEASNGLGLFTSQYMAKLFKGIITVESTLNEGSTFYLKLPTVTASF
jgi:signal transduction histidine kinase